MVVLFVSQFILGVRTSMDCNRRRLLSPVYHAFSCDFHFHRGISIFHGVAVRGRVFFGKICCLVVSERCVFEFLNNIYNIFVYFKNKIFVVLYK